MKNINLFIDGVDYSKQTEDRPYRLPKKETGGLEIYVSEKDYKNFMKPIDEEKQKRDYLTRCSVPGKNGKSVMCRHKCEECPYQNLRFYPEQRFAVSLDRLSEEDDFEARSEADIKADIFVSERKEAMWNEIRKLSSYEQTILDLWSKGKNSREIETLVGVSKSKVDRDVRALITLLKERLKDF